MPIAVAQKVRFDLDYEDKYYLLHQGRFGIVHQLRNSLNYVGWNKRDIVAADLKRIYTAATEDEAAQYLTEFEAKWHDAYPPIAQSWRNNWARVIPFFDYPPEIRRIIYTTNAIESVNMSLRKVTKSRGAFPMMKP